MSTNLVHVLTVIGKAARQVHAACEELLGRRVERHPKSYGSEDWSEAHHKAIEEFSLSLINTAPDLPILYYARYLDSWDVADSRFSLLQWPDGRRRQICGDLFGLVFYPSEFCQSLLAQIKTLRRKKLYRKQYIYRWFLDHVREALLSALWLEAPFLVVSISQCLGPSRDDEQIRQSLDLAMPLTQTPNS